MKSLRAKALQPGDTIALVAPAGIPNVERVERAVARYEEMGFRIKTYGELFRAHGYLAGDDATRADELMEALCDTEVAAVFPVRGGTGVSRLLDMLDYAEIRKSPKIVTGFSDITALHAALLSQTGLVTFHSPNPSDGLGMPDGMTDLSARTFWRCVLRESYSDSGERPFELPLTEEERAKIRTYAPGKANGRVVGGNLALICAVMGTPYEVLAAGSILLLEDVGEQPYRVDRFLAQLRLAGKLDLLSGVILGQFTECDAPEGDLSLSLEQIFADYFTGLGIPIVSNYPVGHAADNATIPLGVEVELDADRRTITVLDCPVRLK